MKLQDIVFFAAFLALLLLRKRTVFVWAGLLCYLAAISLFAKWIFFTAERLTWYGSAFILASIIIGMVQKKE